MVFDVSVAMTWLLYLALFPMAFIWLRRAWRIAFQRDHSEVALKGGDPPADAARWAPYAAAINGVAGGVALGVVVAVALGALDYEHWTAIAGTTIWSKFLLDFALSRHAHGFAAGKRI